MQVKGTEEVTAENEPQVRESSGEGRDRLVFERKEEAAVLACPLPAVCSSLFLITPLVCLENEHVTPQPGTFFPFIFL